MLRVKVKLLNDKAVIPTYATDGSGCFDIYACEDAEVIAEGQHVFSTGLSFAIPEGHVMLVFSRSGHGFKHNVRLANCVGVIDSDYRGELLVKLTNDSVIKSVPLLSKNAIAQGLVLPIEKVVFEEVYELDETTRGTNGFGSTNK